jgi:ribonuclease J
MVVTLVVQRDTGRVLSGPEIISRGFVYVRESGELLERARAEVLKAVQDGGNRAVLSNQIKEALTRFVYSEIKRRPLIVPVVMEV